MTLSIEGPENGVLLVHSPALPETLIISEKKDISIKSGSPVSIEAKGNPGYDFTMWNGFEAEEKSIFFTLSEDKTIGADFSKTNYMATLDKVENGTVLVQPEIKQGKTYRANTQFTLKAKAAEGYVLDSLYYAVPGPWWVNYYESVTENFTVDITSDMKLGASFIEASELEGFKVIQNIQYARPGIKSLKYDIYTPDGAENLPLIVIIHGGGWSSNNEDIMRGMAREMVKTGKYVVASIDYRWIGHFDGDATLNTVDYLIEDVYGALAHIIENANAYGADSGRIALTGDSAGGHLSASAATMIERIGDGGFGIKSDIYEYLPTYLPEDMSALDLKEKLLKSVKVVAPSYGVFDRSKLLNSPLGENYKMTEGALSAASPIENIPSSSVRAIPHFLIRGTKDSLIQNESVQMYHDVLIAAGQTAVYIQVEGAEHAFFDWKPDGVTKEIFATYGIPCIKEMLTFMDLYL